MVQEQVLIIDGARTPMGGLGGCLASVPAPQLAAVAAGRTLLRSGISGDDVDDVFMGCVLPAGLRQCPARQTAIAAGVSVGAGAVTVNKACGSGMQAAIFGFDSIRAGTNRVVLAGGMESMSNAPHLLPGARSGFRLGSTIAYDHMMMDGLEDAYEGRPMAALLRRRPTARALPARPWTPMPSSPCGGRAAPSTRGRSPTRWRPLP